MRQELENVFASWGMPDEAVAFLGKLWEACQALDDIKDGDQIENRDSAIYTLIFDLPCDPFLGRYRPSLAPLMATAYYKWQAANYVETSRERSQLDKAFVWRASFYDVVLGVVALCLTPAEVHRLAPEVLRLYGERREDYVREFDA